MKAPTIAPFIFLLHPIGQTVITRVSPQSAGPVLLATRLHASDHKYFAAYQFDSCRQPLPIIHEVLAVHGPRADSDKIAAWSHRPDDWISDNEALPIAPMDALDRPRDVIATARRNQDTYVA